MKKDVKKEVKTPAKQQRKWVPVLLLSVGVVTLMLAQSAMWINQTIFNQASFTNITTTSLTQQSSRDAIASRVVDQALADRPIAKRVAGDRAKSIISGFLDSDLAYSAIQSATNASYKYLTTSDRNDIAIDLTGIKAVGAQLVELAGRNSDGQDPANQEQRVTLPDTITIVESDKVPNLSGFVTLMLTLAPLFWLGTLVCFALYLYFSKWGSNSVYTLLGVIAGASILGLLTGPFIPPAIASLLPSPEGRIVVQNLAIDLIKPFQQQMVVAILVSGFAASIYSLRGQIYRLFSKIK